MFQMTQFSWFSKFDVISNNLDPQVWTFGWIFVKSYKKMQTPLFPLTLPHGTWFVDLGLTKLWDFGYLKQFAPEVVVSW
jgi:hypothetical protein